MEHWPWDRFAPPAPPPSAARGSAARPKRGAPRARTAIKAEEEEEEEEGAPSDVPPVQAPKRRGRAREASRAKAAAGAAAGAAAVPLPGALPPSLPAVKLEPREEKEQGPAADAKPQTRARARGPTRRKQVRINIPWCCCRLATFIKSSQCEFYYTMRPLFFLCLASYQPTA